MSGFRYRDGLIDPAEEADLLTRFGDLPLEPFDFQGFKGNRETVAFGSRYDFTRSQVREAAPIPGWLADLKAKAASFADLRDDDFRQALTTRYKPGAGWHQSITPAERLRYSVTFRTLR